MMLLPLLANAEAVEINGIYYNLSTENNTAEVVMNPNKYSGEIVIPESANYEGTSYSVTSIGSVAFLNCSGLTSIEIPNSVTSIGYYAFYGCSGLTSIEIPNSVTTIEYGAFDFCKGLTGVYISDIAAWCNISFSDKSSNPLHYARHLFLNRAEVKDLVIPNSVTSIGSWAFDGCLDLTSVTIPYGVKEIGKSTFSSCENLIAIKVENGNPFYDSRDDCNAIIRTADNELVVGCSNTIIPNGVTSIGEGAFYGCSGLTSITIPNGVTSIGEGAFYGCSGLTSITIPNSVTSIGEDAFSGCTSLPIIDNYRYADTYLIEVVDKTIATCTIKDGTRFIGSGAFFDCTKLASVTIPNSVISIECPIFGKCDNIKTIKVENGNPIYDSRDDCNAIIRTADNELIVGCSNTIIPNGVTSIGEDAFYDCSGLTSITIPNSVTSIGYYAFENCSSLTSITIPNGVTSIGIYAFYNCI